MNWQPIETAPKDGTWIWAYWPEAIFEDRQCPAVWEYHVDGYRWTDPADSKEFVQPTHWMPLPAPPVDADD